MEAVDQKTVHRVVQKQAVKETTKLVVWTLTNDLVDYGKRFQEQTGVKVDTVVIEPADYPTKVQTACGRRDRAGYHRW